MNIKLNRGFGIGSLFLLALIYTWANAADAGRQLAAGSAGDALAAMAKLAPGDTLVLADGSYDLGKVRLTQQATEAAPIEIRAEHTGKVIFTNKTGFVLDKAAYITLDGCVFATSETAPVRIQGSDYIRVTRNTMRVAEARRSRGTPLVWVEIAGSADNTVNSHHNRIDHNLMDGKRAIGPVVANGGIAGEGSICQIATYTRIDHNYFRKVGPRISNGMETIRAGLSWLTLSSGHIVIEDNIFEECDGDPEVISIKNCDTIVRGNTFIRCQGGICLRHGNRNEVSGNFFFGEHKADSRGVRFYGDDHKIFNNYFQDLTGPVLEIAAGDVEYPADAQQPRDEQILIRHVRPRRPTIAFNTFVNDGLPVEIGGGRFPAQDFTFANNLATSCDQVMIAGAPPQDSHWMGNIFFPGVGRKLGVIPADAMIKVADPQLKLEGKLYRPAPGSPAIHAASGSFDFVKTDMDGQERGAAKDVGADQVAEGPVTNKPLTPADVGPESAE